MTVKNLFTDPAGNLPNYSWHINHLEMDGPARSNNVSFEGRSDNLGVVAFQGDWQPLIMRMTGTILHQEQHVQFWKWRHIENTFRFQDFEGGDYEVSMLAYEPRKVRVAWNPQDASMRYYKIEYAMELWVVRSLAGDLFDAGVPS